MGRRLGSSSACEGKMAKQTEDERGRLDPPASITARPKADRHGSDHKVGENWFLQMRASYGDSSSVDQVEFPESLGQLCGSRGEARGVC